MPGDGRPVEFTPDHPCWDEILEKHANGTSINRLLNTKDKPEHWPSVGTFFNVLNSYPDIFEKYQRAREANLQTRLDQADDYLADDSQDFYDDGTGKLRVNSNNAQRQRTRAGFLQWQASKLIKDYQDKIDINHNVNVHLRNRLERVIDVTPELHQHSAISHCESLELPIQSQVIDSKDNVPRE